MSHATRSAPPTVGEDPDEQLEQAARRYVQQLRVFYTHAAVFAGCMVIIVVVNLATNVAAGIAGDWSAWWSAWAFIGWSLGVGVHGLVVRLARPMRPTSSWEQQQIEKVLAR